MCRVSAFRRDMRSEAAEGAASAQHGERRDETERRGGDMATRFIGGMIAEGLPEIAGAVPTAGGVVVEVDTALEAATVARDAKPEDGLTVDGVIVAAYAPVYVRGRSGEHWLRA